MDIREQKMRNFLYPGRKGLYTFDVYVIEEVTQKAGFCKHICIR